MDAIAINIVGGVVVDLIMLGIERFLFARAQMAAQSPSGMIINPAEAHAYRAIISGI